jgi:cytoskeleton protein RodZ
MESKVDEATPENEEFTFHTVGEQLKAERERRGWSFDDVANRTRIPIRHLEAIEKSQFSKIPGSTYALGFARSYARAMEMDEVKLTSDLRIELSEAGHGTYPTPTQNYEPADPSSVPSKMLAWTAAGIGVLAIAGYFLFRSMNLDGGTAAEPVVQKEPVVTKAQPAAPNVAPTVDTAGAVVMTATGVVWVKVYDAEKKRMFESEMKVGDTFTVPTDANGPMIVTGRPDLLTFTVGGKAVAPLGTGEKTIADVGISAKDFADRAAKGAEVGAGANIAPATQTATQPGISTVP